MELLEDLVSGNGVGITGGDVAAVVEGLMNEMDLENLTVSVFTTSCYGNGLVCLYIFYDIHIDMCLLLSFWFVFFRTQKRWTSL